MELGGSELIYYAVDLTDPVEAATIFSVKGRVRASGEAAISNGTALPYVLVDFSILTLNLNFDCAISYLVDATDRGIIRLLPQKVSQ
jgi:hypothetical protein